MNSFSPFDDLQDSFIAGDDRTGESPHRREVYLEVLNCEEVQAQRWFACGISPSDARRFVAMGLSPEEAASWGLNASMVERFRALGFVKSEARKWALAGVWPDHAVHWRRREFGPETARAIIDHSDSASAALAWTLVLEDVDLFDIEAKRGVKPGPMLAEQGRTKSQSEE